MKYILKILREENKKSFFEEFELEYIEGSNIISALLEIQKNPINTKNGKVLPVSFEAGCLEEVCGACSMLINSIPMQACTTLIKPLIKNKNFITLAPLSKFDVLKDLVVDRSKIFDQLKKVHAWIDDGENKKIDPKIRDELYELSKCMSCGVCMEACPNYNERNDFIGPAAVSQAKLFIKHPLSKNNNKRMNEMVSKEGVFNCGNSQNCKKMCPKNIPLTESIVEMQKASNKYFFKKIFAKFFRKN
ncbi:MAG: succinate dehydrogenase iron-sulfur subunit [Chlamydiae bacterium RIFCSPHIGHO2_12_FULL_27_8]|nr:MAG: succinate dehydrogenase iron-sulfur subunit [Chlamydiae bacterium RIFCSPHIGHO2_12_FULL_27_8]